MPNEVARWVFDLREIALPAQAHTMASITPEEANKWIQMVHPELPALLVNACQDIIEYNLAACLAFRLDPASVKEKYRDKYSNVLRLIFTRQAMALIGNWEDHAIEALQDFKLAWARYGHEDCARFQEVADSLPRMGRLLLQKPDLIALQRVKTIRNAEGSEFRLHQRSVALSGGLKLIVYEALDADTRMWLEGLAVRELSRDIEEFKDQPHRIGGTVDIKAEQRGAPSDTDRSAIIDEYAKGRAELHEEDEDGEIGADLEDEAE
ncbi:MAG: hypothetical protein KGJ86_07760 [Chloroflexota bacterium]|nr:hypothetical protein [Chloroflexota bacterium]